MLILATVLAVAGVRSASAQAADAWLTTDSVTVGDRFGLVVSVGHDGARSAVFPHDLREDSLSASSVFGLGDFEILDIRSRGSRPFSGGGVIDSVVYETTTFAIDTARVAGVPVRLDGPADTLALAAGAIVLPVTSLLPADAEDIRDLKPLAEFPRVWWPWIVGALVLAAVAAALWVHRRRQLAETGIKAEEEPSVPPYEQAMQRLHELDQLDVELSDNVKPYYVEISDVLRTYFGRRVRVKALESTTRELLDSLEYRTAEEGVPESIVDEAREILGQADLVKFADVHPVWETNRRVMTLTKSTIETTERALRSREEERRQQASESADDATADAAVDTAADAAADAAFDPLSADSRPNGSPSSESRPSTTPSADSSPTDPYAPPESR